ncbi:glutamyl-tRNA amidotransferase subunit A [Suillus subalutaceus]|uniref:glutamyl-tRNA amidotransferase subunit A n=1 Tax=Suillus subalutaceus TaxID=48586 RepID=UPI001B8871E0|nr:glutamyl-tRNA amidotransferase subunit A [Suillus subalutaceus]KAG1841228.1 glutamyl-tRNA amidotransferase subunit A [Suillus subalutaceus]
MFVIELSLVLSTLLSVVSGVACVTYGISPRNGQPLPDLLYATINDLQSGLAAGTFTSVDLVNAYVARINEVNPVLHAVIETNPDALAIAASLDAERADGSTRGNLHGIPICIKDNIATLDKMNNTAGSFALLGAIPPSDSTVAAKLKAAGAIIIGKCNLSQWANYRSSNSTNGWTSRGGQTMGAYYPMQDPSGSSSGPGVVSSIGLAAAAVGTETSGSIISPSSRNSLTGIKPSVGLTSRYLVVPISQTQDTVGPLTRTMMDAAYILSVIAGQDSHDNYTSAIPFETIPDYAAECSSSGLENVKIGIPRNAITVSSTNGPEITAFNASIDVFKQLGATIVDNADFPDLAGYLNFTGSSYTSDPVVGADFVYDVANYFNEMTTNPNSITDLQQLINFTETYVPEDYPNRNVATWLSAASLNITMGDADYYTALLEQYYYGSNATILGALEKYDLDALIIPSSMSPGYAAIAGYPIVTVPLGYYPATTNVTYNSRGTLVSLGPNFPFGLSFYGRRFSEASLVKYACAFEAATNYRQLQNPYIIPNIQLIDVM